MLSAKIWHLLVFIVLLTSFVDYIWIILCYQKKKKNTNVKRRYNSHKKKSANQCCELEYNFKGHYQLQHFEKSFKNIMLHIIAIFIPLAFATPIKINENVIQPLNYHYDT
uniref:Uncharacterized protein n=1 Tax=Prolemur simus TaxID=1328070 RepID=A0A8C8YDF0_PROSS